MSRLANFFCVLLFLPFPVCIGMAVFFVLSGDNKTPALLFAVLLIYGLFYNMIFYKKFFKNDGGKGNGNKKEVKTVKVIIKNKEIKGIYNKKSKVTQSGFLQAVSSVAAFLFMPYLIFFAMVHYLLFDKKSSGSSSSYDIDKDGDKKGDKNIRFCLNEKNLGADDEYYIYNEFIDK